MSSAFHPRDHVLEKAADGGRVAAVGLGAIGGPTADALARQRGVRSAVLVDPDRIDAGNLWSQCIMPTDVNHPKVTVHRRRMRRINPELPVQTWQRRVECVPLGVLRNAIIVSAPDSRETRRHLGEIAWYLGSVLIDAGVEPTGALLRVTIYLPGTESACVCCLFSDEDFSNLPQRFPCNQATSSSFATNAPFSLGLAASAHQTLELHKLFTGAYEQMLVDRQLVIDCRHHRQFVTTLRRNPACRFAHDPPWSIVDFAHTPDELTLDQLFGIVCPDASAPTLCVPAAVFVTRLTCRVCGGQRGLLRLATRLRPAQQRCRSCGGELLATAVDVRDRLSAADVPSALRERPLSVLGLERADIVAICDGARTHHVQLGRVDHSSSSHQEDLQHGRPHP